MRSSSGTGAGLDSAAGSAEASGAGRGFRRRFGHGGLHRTCGPRSGPRRGCGRKFALPLGLGHDLGRRLFGGGGGGAFLDDLARRVGRDLGRGLGCRLGLERWRRRNLGRHALGRWRGELLGQGGGVKPIARRVIEGAVSVTSAGGSG
jgi:hypothetical protein